MTRIPLSNAQKKNLSKDAQTLIEAGYILNDLTLSNTTSFLNFLKDMFEKEYAAKAREELSADERGKSKISKVTQ